MNIKSFYGKRVKSPVVAREIPIDSDDSILSSSDDNDEDYNPPPVIDEDSDNQTKINESSNHESQSSHSVKVHNLRAVTGNNADNEPSNSVGNTNDMGKPVTKKATRVTKIPKRRPLWKKDSDTSERRLPFTGDSRLGNDILCLKTPIQFFRKLFLESLEQYIVEQSNLYSAQCRPQKPLQLTVAELEKFLGSTMWMSLVALPSTRRYWISRYNITNVSEVMPVNKWHEIKRFIHFNNNATIQPNGDRLHKIRPLLTRVRDCLNAIPKEESLCVDEQIVPFKGRSFLKQYNKSKPHKWGYKIWVLSGKSGFAYDMEVFTGNENEVRDGERDCGSSSNVVMRLARSVQPVGHKLYFDNYFTSLDLMIALEHQSIQSVGTVRVNRLQGLAVMSEKEMKKEGRGSMAEYTTTIDGVVITCVQWYDNKVVSLLSTYVGTEPQTKVKRWFSAEKQRKEISCPQIINSVRSLRT